MADFDVDDDLIRRLAQLMNETGLSEIEVADGDRSLRVARPVATSAAVVAAAPPVAAAAPSVAEHPNAPTPAKPPVGAVTSPMVGTVYLASEPGAPPFVKTGDRVAEGDTLLIVEAMKVMNPIRAPQAGTIREILVQDSQPVEFGEMLLILE